MDHQLISIVWSASRLEFLLFIPCCPMLMYTKKGTAPYYLIFYPYWLRTVKVS